MKRVLLTLLLCSSTVLSFINPAYAELKLVGPETAPAGASTTVRITGLPSVDLEKTLGENLKWTKDLKVLQFAPAKVEPLVIDSRLEIDYLSSSFKMSLVFAPEASGTYVIVVKLGDEIAGYRLDVGAVNPTPPGPGPVPPGPLPVSGMRVLILEEDKDRSKLTPEQLSALPIQNTKLLSLLNQKCAKDNQTPAWRVLDDDYTAEDLKNLPKDFIPLYESGVAASKGVRPWLTIASPAGVVQRPYFATAEEAEAYFSSVK